MSCATNVSRLRLLPVAERRSRPSRSRRWPCTARAVSSSSVTFLTWISISSPVPERNVSMACVRWFWAIVASARAASRK